MIAARPPVHGTEMKVKKRICHEGFLGWMLDIDRGLRAKRREQGQE